MVNTELHCVQLFIWYIHLVTTLMLDKLLRAAVYCHAVHCVLRIVELCSEVFDYGVRMLPITAVMGSQDFGLCIRREAQWGIPDKHRKGGLCRWQQCSPNAERGLGHWDLWFVSRECDAEMWLLVAGGWHCDWRRSNRPWCLCHVLFHVSQQITVARLHIDESVRPNETSNGSLECWSRHPTPWKHQSRSWYNPARCSVHATSWTASKFQHLFRRLPFASSWVPFWAHWLWFSPFCRHTQVRKYLWRCENDARHPPCSSLLHHCEIYIEHTYRIPTMPVCTLLHDWMWDAERGYHLVETGLQLQAGTGSFPSSPSHSIEILTHMTYFMVWGRGKQERITRLHCTCWAGRASSWSGKSTSGGGPACRCAVHAGGRASRGRSRCREYVETHWILSEHGFTRVRHRLPWCWHRGAFHLGCDPAGGVACQEEHNLQVHSLDTPTKDRQAARDDVGRYTQGNLQAILLQLVCNTWSCHLHREHCNTRSWCWDLV